jgi:DNA-binding CsgD family transcriptional regulator
VLAFAAQGLTDRATAWQLQLSPRTVRAYLQQARRELGGRNTTHAVAIALGHGLIDQAELRRPATMQMEHERGGTDGG